MNIKQQINTIRSYGTPSIFKGINLWMPKNINEEVPNSQPDYHWFYNGLDSGISANDNGSNPFAPVNCVQLFRGRGSFQRNLDLLNARINTIHKELSYWDLYRITNTVTSEQSFPSVISSLAVGSAAVINCDSFDYNQERYRRGDVVVKISDSQEILIKAVNTGVYKPDRIVPVGGIGGNNYIIQYIYTEEAKPSDPPVPLQLNMSTDSTIYGHVFEMSASTLHASFLGLYLNSSLIKPVIKAFINTASGLEEIEINEDMTVNFSDDNWTIDIDSSVFGGTINNLIIQVK